jgi:hypothetical protein
MFNIKSLNLPAFSGPTATPNFDGVAYFGLEVER